MKSFSKKIITWLDVQTQKTWSVATVLRQNVGRVFCAFFLKKYKMLKLYLCTFKTNPTDVIPS